MCIYGFTENVMDLICSFEKGVGCRATRLPLVITLQFYQQYTKLVYPIICPIHRLSGQRTQLCFSQSQDWTPSLYKKCRLLPLAAYRYD